MVLPAFEVIHMGNKQEKQIAIKGFDKIITPKEIQASPEDYWTCEWVINQKLTRKEEIFEIGTLRFLGKPENGCVEVDIQINEGFRNKNYASETLKAVTDWCFAKDKLFIIDAHIDSENRAALTAFTKAGFVYRSKDKGIEHYSIIKPANTWLGIYMVIGVWAGLLIGVVTSSPAIGFAIGLLIGLIMGKILENKAKKKREELMGTILGDK